MLDALKSLPRRLFAHFLLAEGSTRVAALLRIGLVALLWTKFGDAFLLFRLLNKGPDVAVIGLSFYLSTALLFIGLATRFASAWAGVTALALYYWLGTGDGADVYRHHHTALLCLSTAFLALTPSGGSWSVDRWLTVRRAERAGQPVPPERGPLWGQRLMALQVSVLYLATSYDKYNVGFLKGAGIQHNLMPLYFGSDYPTWAGFPELAQVIAVGTVLVEFGLGVGLWFRRTQLWFAALGILFHASLYVALPVSTFSATMWLLYLAFLDPDEVHRFIDRLSGPAPGRAT